jgi:hypothetical protein
MIDNFAEWAWNVPSIDEYWDNIILKSNDSQIEEVIRNLPEGHLKEYIILKVRHGVGKPIIMIKNDAKMKRITWDVRDFETYVKFKNFKK